ncbi:MAG: PEGA domain-containing protein [Bacteroidota bacterium]|nr:PEGA domain-containing protein [Bacteroidota bacterium]
MKKNFLSLFICISLSSPFSEALSHNQLQTTTISINSNLSGVKVFVDSMLIGITPLKMTEIETGKRVLRCIHPDSKNWSITNFVETLYVRQSDQIERSIIFPSLLRISSEPYGASILIDDSISGTTPKTFLLHQKKSSIKLSKDGFETSISSIPLEGGIIHLPLTSSQLISPDSKSLYLDGRDMKNLIPIYITTSTTILSGVTAAYFKIKADRYYRNYLQTNENDKLTQVRQLDTAAGISLFVCEISIFTLSYLLLTH